MAITYTWNFEQLDSDVEKNDLNDVIVAISWRLTGVDDGGKQASIHSKTQIGDPNADNFTAYDDVTKAEVKNWVLDSLEEDEDALEARVEALVLEQITPTKKYGVPSNWS
tara:strand:+ start:2142 stop:2471 length:330 start_codon:yes stop_codon:yes gene_type:complete